MIYFISIAQTENSLPRLNGDTLITTSGFNVIEGGKLKMGTGTMIDGDFKFVRISTTSMFQYTGTK